MREGICCRPALGFDHLKKVVLHDLAPGWDRRGRIASLYFEPFPNREHHKDITVFSVRALTSLLSSMFTLQDLDSYDYSEINFCWVTYDYSIVDDEDKTNENWVNVTVHHKYWGDNEIHTFRELLRIIARHRKAEIIDRTEPPVTN
jgi:hypothetical protein